MNSIVIVDQGYVGLPLAQAASKAGLHVVGLDASDRIVEALNAGYSHIDDLSDDEIRQMLDRGSHYGIENTPKLVGGASAEATKRAVALYEQFVTIVVPMHGTSEAETAKLLENTYRHINIALVNEMARFCHEMDIDIWEVIRGAATKPYGFQQSTEDLEDAAAKADVVVVLQNHSSIDLVQLANAAQAVFDTRGCMDGRAVERL